MTKWISKIDRNTTRFEIKERNFKIEKCVVDENRKKLQKKKMIKESGI